MRQYRNGLCSVCGIRRMVCRDGTIGHHHPPGQKFTTCPGALQPPAAGSVIENDKPFDTPARPQPRGICPDCRREAAVINSGVMAAHNWYQGGMRMGTCVGSHLSKPLPPETS